MKKKVKVIKTCKNRGKITQCLIFNRQRIEIEKGIDELITASDDFSKNKWCWSVILATNSIVDCRHYKSRKLLCQQCKSYVQPRRRLAELVIIGTK